MANAKLYDALFVSWTLDDGASSPDSLLRTLAEGEERHLYRMESWMVDRGEGRATLKPEAPLDEIAEALWKPLAQPVATRWLEAR